MQHSMQLRLELAEPAGSASCVPQVLARLDAEQQAAQQLHHAERRGHPQDAADKDEAQAVERQEPHDA